MMELLPPAGWGDIATRADLDHFAVELRSEMAELRGEMRGEMAEMRGEMAELRGEMAGLVPRLYIANLAGMIGVAGLVLAAAHFA